MFSKVLVALLLICLISAFFWEVKKDFPVVKSGWLFALAGAGVLGVVLGVISMLF